MSNKMSNASNGGIGAVGVIQIVFIILKLTKTGIIGTWSWFKIMLPIICSVSLMCCCGLFTCICGIMCIPLLDKKSNNEVEYTSTLPVPVIKEEPTDENV